jgi:hypothetical protein
VAGGVGLLVWMAADADLEVDMVDAALIEAGEDGLEGYGAVGACELDAAEEGELVGGLHRAGATRAAARWWAVGMVIGMIGVEVWWRSAKAGFGVAGVDAEGVAVPEVDGGVGDGGAGADVEDGDMELEGDAGLVLCDAGAEKLVSDVEGADLLLGDECGGGGSEGEGVAGEVQGGCGGEGGGDESAAGESVFNGRPRAFLLE